MAGAESDCFISLVPDVSKEELNARESEAAERAIIFAAKIKAKKDDKKLPKGVNVE